MSNALDVSRLIAEVQKRPPLWDDWHELHGAHHRIPSLWQEVAQNVGANVEECKRKWKYLCDTYRAESKRTELQIEKYKKMDAYDPNINYNSKWMYFPALSFLGETTPNCVYGTESENINSNLNGISHYDESYNSESISNNGSSGRNIKFGTSLDVGDRLNLLDDDDEAADDILLREFENKATPQAAERLSTGLSMNNSLAQIAIAQQVNATKSNSEACYNRKCSKRTEDQLHFLENLGREERKLIKSTRQDITRCNKFDHIGDSDYNFLVSFLPNMKKMSELQNLQFRAKMCEMVLNILSPTVTADVPDPNRSANYC